MRTLNSDLTFREIYLSIRERKNIEFIATRSDIGFNNIEAEFPNINFDFPFPLNELQNLRTVIDILMQESIGLVQMEPYQKLRLLVKVFQGQLFYEKIGTGATWRVFILFQ